MGVSEVVLHISVWLVFINTGSQGRDDVCDKDGCTKPEFLGNFHIPLQTLPRYSFSDKRVHERLQNELPVVITDSRLFLIDTPWDMDYLERTLSDSPGEWQVFKSDARKFLYYCNDCNVGNYKFEKLYTGEYTSFKSFMKLFRKYQREKSSKRMYMETGFYSDITHNAVYKINSTVIQVINGAIKGRGISGSPWFYVGMKDVYTPLHYDYEDKLYIMIHGYKRAIIIPPEHYGDLYPYPKHHPLDRNCQVDMENPDYKKFPKYKNVKGYEAILGPGDLLYFPFGWWHLFESERQSETVSLSLGFTSKHQEFQLLSLPPVAKEDDIRKDGNVIYHDKKVWHEEMKKIYNALNRTDPYIMNKPASLPQMAHIKRAIEQLIAESTGNYKMVGPILKELYEGRFDNLEFN